MNLVPRSAIFGFVVVAIIAIAWFTTRASDRLPQTYRNNTYGFSLRLPADYTVVEAPNANPKEENNAADIIVFANKSDSVQLTITYASSTPSVLTVQSLLSNSPWLSSVQTQPFPIAPNEIGLAINGDPTHPDQASDVWFARNGYLYQLTAYGDGFSELLPIARSLALR
jgi:hypothetical protein